MVLTSPSAWPHLSADRCMLGPAGKVACGRLQEAGKRGTAHGRSPDIRATMDYCKIIVILILAC